MITVTLVGDAELKAKLAAMGPGVHSKILREMSQLTIELQRNVQGKLSGEVLKNRTGTLRRSITQRVEDHDAQILGIVGADMREARYAAAHEYGFHGSVEVKEHERRISMAFGKPITPRTITVGAHPMRMNLPERSYLRSALQEFEARAVAGLDQAVKDAIAP